MTDKDRLTKQELSWLLTQEARAAAHTLRQGVSRLSQVPPTTKPQPASVEIESSLDALDVLDDAMRMLDSLNTTDSKRMPRGNTDLAALLGEVLVGAKLCLQPGSGTEVYGDEGELRRMVQMMVRQSELMHSGADAPEVQLSRQGEYVRLSVALGPDAPGADRTERAWLARMALRYGGRLELNGGQETLFLPAAGAHDHTEMEALRKELHEAQQQGEAYARELAAVFATQGTTEQCATAPSTIPPPNDTLTPIAGLCSAISSQIKALVASLAAEMDACCDSVRCPGESQRIDTTRLCYLQLQELTADLGRVVAVDPHETPSAVNVREVVQQVLEQASARAHRREVALDVNTLPPNDVVVPSSAFGAVLRLLVDHAIAASPQHGSVIVSVSHSSGALVLTVDDQGASVPSGARTALLTHRIDPPTVGRPRGVHLLCAGAIMSNVNGVLEFDDSPERGARVRATWHA